MISARSETWALRKGSRKPRSITVHISQVVQFYSGFTLLLLLNMGKNCAVIGCSNSTVKIYMWRTEPCNVTQPGTVNISMNGK